jgi:hypothetical protein
MCYAVTCRTCGKTTWAGCGQHVSSVKSQVPASQWCPGHSAEEKGKTGFFGKLLGR